MIRSNLILFAFFLFSFQLVKSQATKADPVDIQGWFGASVEADLPKKWDIDFSYQVRMNNNIASYNGSYYSIGVKKQIIKPLSFLAEYRLSQVLKGTYNRYSTGLEIDFNIKKIKSDLRVLYQNQIQDFDDPIKETDKDNFFRTRLRGRIPLIKKAYLVLSTEPIYAISPGFRVDNYRHQAGLRYDIKKTIQIEVFYINRPDFGKSYKRQYHIFGTTFSYSFKVKKSNS
jgi:hypothetical protein